MGLIHFGQNGQQHIISPDPQHWCTAGLRPQPTPVLPVHTRLGMGTETRYLIGLGAKL